MSDLTIETEEYHGFTLRAELDPDPMNPREFGVGVGTMYCWHDRYELGDDQIDPGAYEGFRDLLATLVDEDEPTMILPLYLLDHSGITMRTGEPINLANVRLAVEGARSAFMSDPGGWDTSFIGVILDTKEGREKTGVELERIREALESEVKEYASFIEGDVLGWVVEGPDGDVLDCCWGYYGAGPDEMIGEARAVADNLRACDICKGKGYLLNQGYSSANDSGAWIPVQLCDECSVLSGDVSAAQHALKDLGGGDLRIPYTEDLIVTSGEDVLILPRGKVTS